MSDSGERELLAGILLNAMQVIFCVPFFEYRPVYHPQKIALAWVMDNDESDIFSFITVCELLEINPSCLRRMIAARLGVVYRRCPPSLKAARPVIDRPRSQRRYAAKDDDSDGWDAMYKLGSSLHMAGYKEGYRNE